MINMQTTEAGYAKVNLFLEVLGKRSDGYHGIDTVMQTVSLCDELALAVAEDGKGELCLTCNLPYIPTDRRNIAWKAAKAFLCKIGKESDSVSIHIEKKIPVAAGLGGGSADGAAVLRALNRLYGYPLSIEELCELATPLGADIPFCLVGGCRRAEGIGEIFTKTAPLSKDLTLVIAMGRMGSNTAAAYGKLDARAVKGQSRNSLAMMAALAEGDTAKVCKELYNRFEEVILPENKDASSIRRILSITGANGALMSGSGAAVFGIFEKREKAEEAVEMLCKRGFFAVTAMPIDQI